MKNAIILGSGRSGTSMLSGTLFESGYHCGPDLYPPRESNPKGFFESPAINGINEELLERFDTPHAPMGKGQRWLRVLDSLPDFEVTEALRDRMEQVTSQGPYALKDPRFCYTLEAWSPFIADVPRICIFRDPMITATSMLKECRSEPYLHSLKIDIAGALAVWNAMYRMVLDTHASTGNWLFLHCDQILYGDGISRIEDRLDIPIQRTFLEPRLQRTECSHEIPHAAQILYERLCYLAHWAPPLLKLRSHAFSQSTLA